MYFSSLNYFRKLYFTFKLNYVSILSIMYNIFPDNLLIIIKIIKQKEQLMKLLLSNRGVWILILYKIYQILL